jgi:hypothetical protein
VNPIISGIIVQNFVAMVIWFPGFVHPCLELLGNVRVEELRLMLRVQENVSSNLGPYTGYTD